MEEEILKNVEQELHRIINKYNIQTIKTVEFCNENNLEPCLKQISQEFDYFDVSCMEEDFDLSNTESLKKILIQVVNSSYNLIQFQRETKKKQNDSLNKNSKFLSDVKTMTKTIESLQKQNTLQQEQLQENKTKLILDSIKNTELRNKVCETKKELIKMHKDLMTKQNKNQLELNKVLLENKCLKEKFKDSCGKFVSNDKQLASLIDSYKTNEKKYLETINKLQLNNQLLLEEILKLKGEISLTSVNCSKNYD